MITPFLFNIVKAMKYLAVMSLIKISAFYFRNKGRCVITVCDFFIFIF
ncbi:hypothetical protein EDF73_101174 [Raoultella sp. BIGb0138]|nr:hypothetical protein EDF73_101174 [Raoultella sp. BIGb0138]